jgi:hypothetical protein
MGRVAEGRAEIAREREAADQLSKEINAEIKALILGTKKLNENNRGKYNKTQVNSVRF